MVVYAPEVIAAGHGGEGTVERKNFQTMTRKIEFANNFRTEERDDVRTLGKKKAGDDFFGDSGTAEDVAAFQHDDFLPCFGKISGVYQAVVTAADDDNVVEPPQSI